MKNVSVLPNQRHCEVCQSPIGSHPLIRLCSTCGKLVGRRRPRSKPNKEARIRALRKAWNHSIHAFTCYYSGVSLLEKKKDSHSPRYLTYDHRTPGNENDIVVCAALINDMKTDMNETKFWSVIRRLADYNRRRGPPLGKGMLDNSRIHR